MGELVALETQDMEGESKNNTEEDCIDFAAATTATLGVPSPCLSKARSFDDSPRSVSDHQKPRKGDLLEEAELLRVLKLSEAELPTSVGDSLVADINGGVAYVGSDESTCLEGAVPVYSIDPSTGLIGIDNNHNALSNNNNNNNNNLTSLETLTGEIACSTSKADQSIHLCQSTDTESGEHVSCSDVIKKSSVETLVETEGALCLSCGKNTASVDKDSMDISRGGEKRIENQSTFITDIHELADISSGHDTAEISKLSEPTPDSDSSSGRMQSIDAPENLTSSVDESEPIYEGEECILDSGTTTYEDREPMYEGEVILAEQADKTVRSKGEITPQQGEWYFISQNWINHLF